MSVEEIIKQLVAASPVAAALIILAWMFLNAQAKRDTVNNEAQLKRDEANSQRELLIQRLHEEHLQSRKECREALLHSARVTEQNTEIFGRVLERLR